MAAANSQEAVSYTAEGMTKPPSDVVLPPKDIKTIIEQAAGYVVRNGTAFEDRIRQKQVSNPKFSFLQKNDAYYPFYVWRLGEIRAGNMSAIAAGRERQENQATEPEKPKGPEPPPDFKFAARVPNINAQDLDVLRLTALFVAKHGRSFLTSLSQKESTNYQFDFLRPQHSLYQYFSRLIDQYTDLLRNHGNDTGQSEQARMAELTKNIENKFHILDRAQKRAEWVQYQAQEKQKKEEEEEIERLQYAQIDWHDFVVVETVLFDDADDEADLPPPTSLNDLQSASLEQKAMMSLQPHNMRIEEAMPTGEIDSPSAQAQRNTTFSYPMHLAPPPNSYQNGVSTASLAPGAPIVPPPFLPVDDPYGLSSAEARQVATNPQVTARASATVPMKIRSDYVPRAQRARQAQNTALCPNCNQQIPYNELEEHMRIELLDPRWKEQRAKADSRYATTNLNTADVANNLKRLASQRTDLFDGVTGEPVSEEEQARRKRAATQSYDGFSAHPMEGSAAGKAMQSMSTVSIEEQLKHIREKASARSGN